MRAARLAAVLMALGCLAAPATAAPRPNILLVVVDDLNCDVTCYARGTARTPHLDAIAAVGVRFERAYAQVPSCNGSRASFLTGRYPPATRVFDNTTNPLETLPGAATLPRHFRSHGYQTARAGKIAHRLFGDPEAWSVGGAEKPPARGVRKAKKRGGDFWAVAWGGARTLEDYRTADRAIELLRELRDEPFLLAVGFSSTHPPLLAPKELIASYRWQTIRLPEDFSQLPPSGGPAFRPNRGVFENRRAKPDTARKMIAAYRATTSFVDSQLGRVMAELERLGLREQTIVVVTSDHGFHLGERGLWSKSTLFERALRVPLVAAGPGIATGVSPRTVELVDLFPTLVELAGVPAPPRLDGQSLVPLLKEPSAAWHHPARSWLRRGDVLGESVRTERHRFTQWADGAGPDELYDHETDPHERRNRAAEPEQRERVAALRRLVDAAP